MDPKQRRLLASVGLLDLSLVLLWLAGIIQLDATGDLGPDDWNLWVAFPGFLAVGGAVVLSWTDRQARRAVGLTLVTVAVAMVVFGLTVEGFRFVYTPFEAEYVILTNFRDHVLKTRSLFDSVSHEVSGGWDVTTLTGIHGGCVGNAGPEFGSEVSR